MVEKLFPRLLSDQQRHEVPDRSVLEVRPEAFHEDRHLIDRHRRECDVELVCDRLFQVRFACRRAQRDLRARVIKLDRHGSFGSIPDEGWPPNR